VSRINLTTNKGLKINYLHRVESGLPRAHLWRLFATAVWVYPGFVGYFFGFEPVFPQLGNENTPRRTPRVRSPRWDQRTKGIPGVTPAGRPQGPTGRSDGREQDCSALPVLSLPSPIAFARVVSYAPHMDLLTHDELVRLTPPERLALISQLWDSLEEDHLPLTAAQRGELDRRLATLDQDRREGITWASLKAELEQRCP
jgi:putative addiction module component (TIGR02574 family)